MRQIELFNHLQSIIIIIIIIIIILQCGISFLFYIGKLDKKEY